MKKFFSAKQRSFLPLVMLLSSACGGAQMQAEQPAPTVKEKEPSPPKETVAPVASEKEDKLPFMAQATAATEKLAYEQAARRLAVALFNDEALLKSDAFSDQVASSVHLKDENAYEVKTTSEGVSVEIGLAQQELSSAFARAEDALMKVKITGLPAVISGPIRGLRLAYLFRNFCERQKELLPEASCEGADVKEAENEVLHLSKQVKLQPAFVDGIPSDEEVFLRPLRLQVVDAEYKKPLFGIPLIVSVAGDEKKVELSSDKEGKLSYSLPDELSVKSELQVSIDAQSLLGPLHELWKSAPLSVKARPVGLSRSAVVFDERDAVSPTVATALLSSLKKVITQPYQLPRESSKKLVQASAHSLKTQAPLLADQAEGQLDTILVLSGDSEFASRMGTHRVWYEARGKLTVINAWTGKVITEVKTTVTESGVGEERAERASREALGKELALKLQEALKSE